MYMENDISEIRNVLLISFYVVVFKFNIKYPTSIAESEHLKTTLCIVFSLFSACVMANVVQIVLG